MNQIEKDIIIIMNENNLLNITDINEQNYQKVVSEIANNVDSLLYMTILIEIEDKYGIELPDDALINNILENINDFSMKLSDFIEKNNMKGDSEGESKT